MLPLDCRFWIWDKYTPHVITSEVYFPLITEVMRKFLFCLPERAVWRANPADSGCCGCGAAAPARQPMGPSRSGRRS